MMLLTVRADRLFNYSSEAGIIFKAWAKGQTAQSTFEGILFLLGDLISSILFAVPRALAVGGLEALGEIEIVYEDDFGNQYLITATLDEDYAAFVYALTVLVVALTAYATARSIRITKEAANYLDEIWRKGYANDGIRRLDRLLPAGRRTDDLAYTRFFKTLNTLPEMARIGTKVLGWADLLTFAATTLVRISGATTKEQRQATINSVIFSLPPVHSTLYNDSPTPAQDYGMDYPIGLLDIFIWPVVVDMIFPWFGNNLPTEIKEAFAEAGKASFSVGIGILFNAIKILSVELLRPRYDFAPAVAFEPLDLSFTLTPQTVLGSKTLETGIEVWLSAIVAKTLWKAYAVPLWRLFQEQNA